MNTTLLALLTTPALAGGDAPELDTPSSAANPQVEIQNLRRPDFINATLEAWNGLIGEIIYAAPSRDVLKTVFSRLDSNDDGQLKYRELAEHDGKSHSIESWTFTVKIEADRSVILEMIGNNTAILE